MPDQTIEELWRWLREHERMEQEHQTAVHDRLKAIEDTLSQAKGGWRTMIYLGSAVAGAGMLFSAIWPLVSKQ